MKMIDEGFVGGLRKYSAIALLLIGALNTTWAMSPEVQQTLTPQMMNIANGVLAWIGFVGRFIKQAQVIAEQQP